MRRRWTVRRRWVAAAVWAALVMLAGGGLTVRLALQPERLRGRIQSALEASVRGKVQFADPVEVNWWRLSVAVRDLVIETAEGEPVLRARRVAVRPRLGPLLAGRFEPMELVLDAPEARLVREASGGFGIVRALNLEAGAGAASAARTIRCPRIQARGGRLFIKDEGAADGAGPEAELTDLVFSAQSREDEVSFRGEVRHPLARRLSFSGTWDGGRGRLGFNFRAVKVDLAGDLGRLLPQAVARAVRALKLEGFVDLDGRIGWSLEGGFEPLGASGRFLRCRIEPPRLVFPIQDLGGSFAIRGRTIDLRELDGKFGAGRVTGSATLELDSGGQLAGFELAARAGAIPLDHRLRAGLESPGLAAIYDRLHPRGTIGLEVRARGMPQPASWQDVSLRLTADGVEFADQEYPYRFQGLAGEAVIEGGRLVISRPLVARNRGATLTITGRAELDDPFRRDGAPATPGELDLEARVEALPVDDDLREALPAHSRQVWDQFEPSGKVGLSLKVHRPRGAKATELAAFVDLQGVRMLYTHFPYEVLDITGRMNLELGEDRGRMTLSDLRGHHAGQTITGLGVVEWGARELLRIDLRADDLAMNEALRNALPPTVRALLDDFAFHGRAKTDVVIHSTAESGVEAKVDLDLLDGAVSYVLFPYPLSLAGGHFTAIGEHNVRFTEVVTRKLRSDGTPERPRVVFNGGIGLEEDERLLDFRFDIEELDVDERLRRALPPELRQFVESLGLEGTFRGELAGSFACPVISPLGGSERSREGAVRTPPGEGAPAAEGPPPRAPAPSSGRLVYRASRVSARDAAVNFGLQLRRMDAEGQFVGGKDERGNHHFDGSVVVKSAAFNRLQLRDADITFTFGKEHPAVAAARAGRPPAPGEPHPSSLLVERLTPERVRDSFQMLVRKSDLYGGIVQGFLAIDTARERGFAGEFAGEGIQVAKAAPDVFGVAESGATGEGRGRLSFGGIAGDLLSVGGAGEGFIERAKLIELPLFVGLWSILVGKFSAEQHFNEVVVRYTIQDGKFRAASDGMVIKSPGVHLKGGGTMDFEGKLDLTFTPEFLRMKIPVLDQVLGLIKKGLAQVWVTGDLAQPRVRFVTGAGLLRIPIDTRPRSGDRPLPRDLREERGPLPPPPVPKPPGKR